MLSGVQDGLVTCHSLLPLAEIPKNNIYVKKMAQTDQTIYHNFFRTDRCVGRLEDSQSSCRRRGRQAAR